MALAHPLLTSDRAVLQHLARGAATFAQIATMLATTLHVQPRLHPSTAAVLQRLHQRGDVTQLADHRWLLTAQGRATSREESRS